MVSDEKLSPKDTVFNPVTCVENVIFVNWFTIARTLCVMAVSLISGYDAVSDLVVIPFPRRSEIQDQ